MQRRTLFSALWAAFPLSCLGQEKELSADGLKDLLDKKVKLFFLDVREPEEIAELGTIEGYVNIPMSQLESRLGEIPKDALLVAG
jgi:rhodanese-related sulfurtransferase